jgi:protein O-mannosyl-transferase
MSENGKFIGTILLGFFALNLLVFGASLMNGFALLDDGLLIFQNNAIRSMDLATLKTVFTSYDPELYIPLTIVSYQLDYLIGGLHPFIFHFTNLVLHTFNATLVTFIIMMLFKYRWLAILCGVFFAIHPLQVEAVVWASARKDVLSAFYFLSSVLAYLAYAKKHKCPVEDNGGHSAERQFSAITGNAGKAFPSHTHCYALSIALFLLGLLSKVSILTLPIILILADYIQKRPYDRRAIVEKLPYAALSIVFGIIALGGKSTIVDIMTPFEKILLACKGISFYLYSFIAPAKLSVFYPELGAISLTNTVFNISIIITLLLLGWIVMAYRSGNRPHVFALLFFLITLAPTFVTPNKGGGNIFFASDRYMYLPLIGLLLIVIPVVLSFLEKQFTTRIGVFVSLGILGIILSTMSFHQSLLWGDQVQLFDRAVATAPEFYLSYINRGAAEQQAGNLDAAYASFEKAISLRKLGNTYGQLGQIAAKQGHLYVAIGEFKKGIAIDPDDPELHNGLGQVYTAQNQFEQAIVEYETALALMESSKNTYEKLSRRIGPRRDVVLVRLGIVYGIQKNHRKAVEYYEQAIEENPFYADAHYNLGVALGNIKERDRAIEEYRKAISIDPAMMQAHANLGILLANAGRREEAIEAFQKLLKVDPMNDLAGNALRLLGGP